MDQAKLPSTERELTSFLSITGSANLLCNQALFIAHTIDEEIVSVAMKIFYFAYLL